MAGMLIAYSVAAAGGRFAVRAPAAVWRSATTMPTTACRSRSHSGPPLKPSLTSVPPTTSSATQGGAETRGTARTVGSGWPLAHRAMTSLP
ncbi:hypothetical protein SRIMM317S_01157 [Streptomyces rimosus subsp. rimosus]